MNSDFWTRVTTTGQFRQYPRLMLVGEETRQTVEYRYKGRTRPDRPHGIFQFTLEGEGAFRDAQGEQDLPVGKGFLCVSNDPRTAYYYRSAFTQPWRFVFMSFVGQIGLDLVREVVAHHGGVYELVPDHPAIARLRGFRVHDQAGCMLTAGEGGRVVMDVVSALVESKESNRVDLPDHRLVRRAQEQIRAGAQVRIRASDVARRLGVSREHLSRVFRQETGVSICRYMVEEKMGVACALLRDGTLSVKEVSQRLGFAAPAHFVRAFRRVVRLTPGAFRSSGAFPFIPHE